MKPIEEDGFRGAGEYLVMQGCNECNVLIFIHRRNADNPLFFIDNQRAAPVSNLMIPDIALKMR